MKFVLFYHSITSCWNHGNVHFLRGFSRELARLGHDVNVFELEDGWSRRNALAEDGAAVLAEAERLVPGVQIVRYAGEMPYLAQALDGADVVIVHEWSEPALIAAIALHRISGGRFTLLFHDTHHRTVTERRDLQRGDLDGFDGVLAFGESLREIYAELGWGARAFTWHEAADTELFFPIADRTPSADLIWIGNWGDEERTRELHEFLMLPVARLGLDARVHGVRYPARAVQSLASHGIDFAGWLPNHRVAEAFGEARLTVHVPRQAYAKRLPGIPTIRVFEALACGIPLVSAPWRDSEGLFPEGSYLTAANTDAMTAAISLILRDRDLADELRSRGLRAIERQHSCAHRAVELLDIVASLKGSARAVPYPTHQFSEAVV